MKTIQLKIKDGTVSTIFSDEVMPFMRAAGRPVIKRASHVEPTPDNKWVADMAPSGGPILGPFESRAKALEEEIKWLRANR